MYQKNKQMFDILKIYLQNHFTLFTEPEQLTAFFRYNISVQRKGSRNRSFRTFYTPQSNNLSS